MQGPKAEKEKERRRAHVSPSHGPLEGISAAAEGKNSPLKEESHSRVFPYSALVGPWAGVIYPL